jgi:hypothetical protein
MRNAVLTMESWRCGNLQARLLEGAIGIRQAPSILKFTKGAVSSTTGLAAFSRPHHVFREWRAEIMARAHYVLMYRHLKLHRITHSGSSIHPSIERLARPLIGEVSCQTPGGPMVGAASSFPLAACFAFGTSIMAVVELVGQAVAVRGSNLYSISVVQSAPYANAATMEVCQLCPHPSQQGLA